MAHTPHDTERVIEKAFLVRFFTSVTLQEDGDGWAATVEVEEDDERGSER
jgi:hypothetical protein